MPPCSWPVPLAVLRLATGLSSWTNRCCQPDHVFLPSMGMPFSRNCHSTRPGSPSEYVSVFVFLPLLPLPDVVVDDDVVVFDVVVVVVENEAADHDVVATVVVGGIATVSGTATFVPA